MPSVPRKKLRGSIGGRVTPPAEYAYGTDAEIQNRDSVTHQPGPSNFRQIGPSDNPGVNPARPNFETKSGDFKFSRGV